MVYFFIKNARAMLIFKMIKLPKICKMLYKGNYMYHEEVIPNYLSYKING